MVKLDPVERVTLVVTLGSVGAVYALAPPRFALGVAVGAAIEALNLAQDRGYYIASELRSNSDLDVLRGLPEFQELT